MKFGQAAKKQPILIPPSPSTGERGRVRMQVIYQETSIGILTVQLRLTSYIMEKTTNMGGCL
jgi:hypothetical protein